MSTDAAGAWLVPAAVRIREVGPRDGFQNEPEVIATGDKVRLVELLARTASISRSRSIPVAIPISCSLREAHRVLGRLLGSHTLVAGPVDWHA